MPASCHKKIAHRENPRTYPQDKKKCPTWDRIIIDDRGKIGIPQSRDALSRIVPQALERKKKGGGRKGKKSSGHRNPLFSGEKKSPSEVVHQEVNVDSAKEVDPRHLEKGREIFKVKSKKNASSRLAQQARKRNKKGQ